MVSVLVMDFQRVLAVCCWLIKLLHSQGTSVDAGGWDAGMSGEREIRRVWSVGSTGGLHRVEGQPQPGVLLQC